MATTSPALGAVAEPGTDIPVAKDDICENGRPQKRQRFKKRPPIKLSAGVDASVSPSTLYVSRCKKRKQLVRTALKLLDAHGHVTLRGLGAALVLVRGYELWSWLLLPTGPPFPPCYPPGC